MLATTPDSRGQISPSASARSASFAENAFRYSARCACVRRGHGPSSNALRAAVTARSMSAACASATVKYVSSVVESMTSNVESVEGCTHSPPMKNLSACCNGTAGLSTTVIVAPSFRTQSGVAQVTGSLAGRAAEHELDDLVGDLGVDRLPGDEQPVVERARPGCRRARRRRRRARARRARPRGRPSW